MKKYKRYLFLSLTAIIALFLATGTSFNRVAFAASQFEMKHNVVVAKKSVKSNTASAKEVTLQLMNEDGVLLRGVSVNIFSIDGAKTNFFLKEMPTNQEGQVTLSANLSSLPAETQVGIHSDDNLYCQYIKFKDLTVSNGIAKIVVPKAGVILATIKKYPAQIKHPVVVEVFKKDEKGSYKGYTGIGIFLSNGAHFEVECLPTGIYKIQIKDNYDSSVFFFERENVKVTAGVKTDLDGIELNDGI